MSTPALRFLKQRNVPHRVETYEHLEKGARFAASALDYPIERTIKTLVVELSPGGYVLVLMPGHLQADLKALAASLKAKKAALADAATAERLTGYQVGGISPFGTKRRLPVYIEQSLADFSEVAINGGRRGTMLKMDPQDILKALGARTLELGRPE